MKLVDRLFSVVVLGQLLILIYNLKSTYVISAGSQLYNSALSTTTLLKDQNCLASVRARGLGVPVASVLQLTKHVTTLFTVRMEVMKDHSVLQLTALVLPLQVGQPQVGRPQDRCLESVCEVSSRVPTGTVLKGNRCAMASSTVRMKVTRDHSAGVCQDSFGVVLVSVLQRSKCVTTSLTVRTELMRDHSANVS